MSGEWDVGAGVWRVGRGGRCVESGTWGQVSGEWGVSMYARLKNSIGILQILNLILAFSCK